MTRPQATNTTGMQLVVTLVIVAAMAAGGLVGCQPKVAKAPAADFISPELPAPPSNPSVPEHITPTPAPRGMQACWEVWVVDVESGQQQFVSHGMMPLWSPDGSWLAFSSEEPDGGPLGVSVWDGERVRVIAKTERFPTRFAWSSDSRQVIVDYLHVTTPERQRERLELVPFSAADGRQGEPLGPGCILRGWSNILPNPGLCLGLHGQRHVWTVDRSRLIPIGWAGDGRVVSVDRRFGIRLARAPTEVLMVEPVGGGRPVRVCELPALVPIGKLEAIDWSPDLSRLAIALADKRTRCNLKIIDLETRTEIGLGAGQYPHWSPDGKRLVYAEPKSGSGADDAIQKLYVVDAQGGNRRSLAEAHTISPGPIPWSPDSRLVGYSVFPKFDRYGRSIGPKAGTEADVPPKSKASTEVDTPPKPKPATSATQPAPQRPTGVPPTLATFKGRGNATTGEFEAEAHWTVMWKRPSSNDEEQINIRWVRKGGGPKAEGEIVTVQRIPMGLMTGGRSRVVSETGRFFLKVETTGEWEIIVREVQ